jgi:MFS family permease
MPDAPPQTDRDGRPSADGAHDPYAALRHRNFRRFLAANVLSTIGVEMQGVAVGWELYERTGSAMALGLVGLVQALPVLLLALPAGQLADRVSRKGIVLATQAALVAASLGLAAVSHARGPIGLVYGCLALIGVAGAFSFPARWALLPQLVPEAAFSNAVTWRSSAWQVAAVAGPGLGGMALALGQGARAPLPMTWPAAAGGAGVAAVIDPATSWLASADGHSAALVYLIDAALGVLVIGIVASLSRQPRPRVAEPFSWESLLAGVRFVWQTKLILATITLDMFAVLLGGAVTLLPIYAKDILRVGPGGLGWLRAAPSLGAVTMAVTLAHRPPLRRAGRTLIVAVIGFGVATIVFGLSRSYWLSLLMLFLTGAFDNISVVIRATLIQVLTPDAMRGRVSAVNSIFIGMSNELGGFESGLAARFLGAVAAVVAGGIGTILVVLGVAATWPQVGRLGALADAASESPPAPTPADELSQTLSIEGFG